MTYDWAAYFKKFCEVHGEPVPFRGRLLFRDGFMYSASDYSGPEWFPDAAEVEELARQYWSIRLKIVRAKAVELTAEAKNLVSDQYGRSVPLQTRSSYVDDDGKRIHIAADVDRAAVVERIKWLVEDAKECEQMLAEERVA